MSLHQSLSLSRAARERSRSNAFLHNGVCYLLAAYLADEPDLEALVADPQDPDIFYTVTEDATRTGALSARCQQRYKETGSTDYPTLLVRIERTSEGDLYMSRVRPLQFSREMKVGDFPNDGIEGMALGANNTLYLALEKDAEGMPRMQEIATNVWRHLPFRC